MQSRGSTIPWLVLLTLLMATCASAGPVRIGVFTEPGFPKLGAPSDPTYLAEVLKAAGYDAVMLSAKDLADKSVMNPSVMPVVVLSYGPIFPADAVDIW